MLTQFDDEETAAYFERLNAPLRKMPQADRAELHAELRQHLDALAAAHEELGASPDEAAHAALKQFGDPKRIGRRLFEEWRRVPKTHPWHIAGWAFVRLWSLRYFNIFVVQFLMKTGIQKEAIFWLPVSDFLLPPLIGWWAGRRFGVPSFLGLTLASGSSFAISLTLYWILSRSNSHYPPFHIGFQTFWEPFSLLTSAWLAQQFATPSRLSIAALKSRLRR